VNSDIFAGTSVLHIITRLDRGGAADIVLELARMLADDGVKVGIVVGKTVEPQENIDSYRNRTGIPVFIVPCLVRNVSPLRDIHAFLKIRKIIHQFKPNIVHTHTSKAGIIGRFAAWLSETRYIVHTPHGHIFYGYYNALATSLFVSIERLAAKVTDKITLLTQQELNEHLRMKIGPAYLFTVISSGIDVKRFSEGDGFSVRTELGWQDKKIVGWIGRLVPVKDCATFIRTAALIRDRIQDVRFMVVGDGEDRDMLVQLVKELELDGRLVFLGYRSDVPSLMKAIDVFVLSSLNEGFGRVLVEAMAAGVVIVSTRVGGTIDVIEDGISGILVPPSDPKSIADAVCEVLENHELRERLVEGGLRCAPLFNIRTMVNKFEDLYAKLFSV